MNNPIYVERERERERERALSYEKYQILGLYSKYKKACLFKKSLQI